MDETCVAAWPFGSQYIPCARVCVRLGPSFTNIIIYSLCSSGYHFLSKVSLMVTEHTSYSLKDLTQSSHWTESSSIQKKTLREPKKIVRERLFPGRGFRLRRFLSFVPFDRTWLESDLFTHSVSQSTLTSFSPNKSMSAPFFTFFPAGRVGTLPQ